MLFKKVIFFLISISFFLLGCEKNETTPRELELLRVFIGINEINMQQPISTNQPTDRSITLLFSSALNETAAARAISLSTSDGVTINTTVSFSSNNTSVILYPVGSLSGNTTYIISISEELQGANGEQFMPSKISFKTALGTLSVTNVIINGTDVKNKDRVVDVPLTLGISITFSAPVSQEFLAETITLNGLNVSLLHFVLSNENRTVTITTTEPLNYWEEYELEISSTLIGILGETFSGFSKILYTALDPNPKFPVVSDDELLNIVQQQTFKYFYDFAEPASGMARERNTSGSLVTTGGSGFGIMALVVGMERNFIARAQGVERMNKIVSFLEEADRFHGVWPHWINGNSGNVIPFSTKDNGGDLVETSFLVQGLLTFRQYLEPADTVGNDLIDRITKLYNEVEWDWYRKDGQQILYWHWSPNFNWDMNFGLNGYFEEQITYFLAAASPTHSIPKSVYTNGFTQNGNFVRNDTYYGIPLKLGGLFPLFWVHYSYLGLDPHFSDDYVNYWQQNVNASLINHAYCVANPRNYVGYSDECWGLTSSDNQSGYNAHSPGNDLGVISPTAALSSFPYTPEQSMKALKFFYYKIGDRTWGEYGFYDAFNITSGWVANSYLAIDQGPIVVMIENHRTGLLWDLFMSAPEVQNGMTKLNFTPTF